MGQASHEPSMEDILASIKRIIAEDSEAAGTRPTRLRREAISAVQSSPAIVRAADPEIEPEGLPEDEAAEAQAFDQPAEAEEPAAEQGVEAETPLPQSDDATPEDVLELTSPMPETAAAETAAEAPDTASGAATLFAAGIEGLVTGEAATASRNAFAALSQLQVRSEEGKSNTLEGLVADLLRPMLRDWLDKELPPLVERVVTAEVRRLSGGNS